MTATLTPPEAEPSQKTTSRRGDRIFAGLARGAGLTIMLALAAVFIFLFIEGWNGLNAPPETYRPATDFLGYIGPLVLSTILVAMVALIVAVPFAIAIALFISHYAPRRIAAPVAYVVDLLAAVPSVVLGLWGSSVLAPVLARNLYPWLEDNLGFIPLFKGPAAASGRTMMTVAVVLAVMILPIITAISREVFLQTPRLHEEASLALGATRWEMIRQAVLPYGRSGVISGAMLGLGRALGETMAVAIILSPANIITFNIISTQNPNTIAANVALKFPESSGIEVNLLIATGLVLFVLTFGVNVVARRIARAGFSGADG